MEDIILLEAIEKYIAGEMSADETVFFEKLRQENAKIDQQVVEHILFLKSINQYSKTKLIKQKIEDVQQKLIEDKFLNNSHLSAKAKIIPLWKKYKRNIAVVASIAGVISILTSTIVYSVGKKYEKVTYEELVKKINQTNKEVKQLKSEQIASAELQPKMKAAPMINYSATGFLIDGNGYLVTNAHVISKMKNIYVENYKGDYFTAKVIIANTNTDLAIIKIIDSSYNKIPFLPYTIKKSIPDLAEQIFTLGFPKSEIVYGEGYVSSKSGNSGDSTAYQLTVSVNPGNSGGPVVNKYGEIVGIITAKDAVADGVVYAAKANNIFSLLNAYKNELNAKSIKLPTGNNLRGLDRTQQVKKMENFVYMVVGN